MKVFLSILLVVVVFASMFSLEFSIGFFREAHFFFIQKYISKSWIVSDPTTAFLIPLRFALLFAFMTTVPVADNIWQRFRIRQKKGKLERVSWKKSFMAWLVFVTGVFASFTWINLKFGLVLKMYVNNSTQLDMATFSSYINQRQWIFGLLCLAIWYAFLVGRKYRNA